MSRRKPRDAGKAVDPPQSDVAPVDRLELREEELIAHTDIRDLGEVHIRTEVEELPGRLEVDASRDEVTIEHEPVGEIVSERDAPWEEEGVIVVPVYEEQLVVSKQLVLRERVRIRRVASHEHRLIQDTLLHERLVIEDPSQTGAVREMYPTSESSSETNETGQEHAPGVLENLVRKALE